MNFVKVNYLINGQLKEGMVNLEYLLGGFLIVPIPKDIFFSVPDKNNLLVPSDDCEIKNLREVFKLSEEHYIASDTVTGLTDVLVSL